MGEHFFLSYSAVDGAELALSLADKLAAGPPPYPVWLDDRELQAGLDWDEQIIEALRTCRGLLFVLTEDSVTPESVCKQEWVRALSYKKPVIPLLLHTDAELPFRLGSRQFIDFSSDFNAGLARLRDHLAWTSTPAGVLQELRTRRSDAQRELRRVVPERQPLIEREIEELTRQIAAQQQLVEHPVDAEQQTTQRIAAGLERERRPEQPVSAAPRARFVNPPPMTAPTYFQGRETETALVADYLRTPGLRMTTVVGRGGVGKTALVCRLLKALEAGRLPDDLGELHVNGIVYLSPVGAHPVNFPNLFADLCRLLPEDIAERLRQRYRDPQQTPAGLMLSLLEAFPDGRSVVLLDNAEDVVDAGTGAITDPGLDEALRTLLTAPEHGVKLVVTSRVAPRDLLLTQPARQRRLNLDEGLPSPHAEHILRAMDPDGRLGLRTAPDALLTRARDRTRGYPRALEALAGILAADRNTTLLELLAETERLPDNVVHALVGEAFTRLDPLVQQVMQALAIYTVPVPPVAVDYLLQPYRSAIDAAPVLIRLVNMQFVRRDAGRYYLHQVDRDYALHRIPLGEPADRDADPPPFTQHALRHQGADYFEQTRTPRETWKTLDDVAPQLAEFDLRCQAQDYDTAALVLQGINYSLTLWGHYRLTIDLHQRLQGHLTDPWTKHTHLSQLGSCYLHIGQIPTAIDHHQQALTISRDTGDQLGEASELGCLGRCYEHLGQTTKAIDHHQQALAISRDTGDREGEGTHLGNLANCYSDLGQIPTALDYYQQALTISRDTGFPEGEATDLGNLGSRYADLGQTTKAIDHHERALTIAQDIGDQKGNAHFRLMLGDDLADQGGWPASIEQYRQAIQIADEIGYAQVQCEGRLSLAQARLLTGDPEACRATAKDATAYDYPPQRPQVHLLFGIAQLRQGEHPDARQSLIKAVEHADEQLQHTPENYYALDCKALASCGLALDGQPDHLADAIAAFRAARAITTAPGIVARTLRLLDAIAASDPAGLLTAARAAAQGRE